MALVARSPSLVIFIRIGNYMVQKVLIKVARVWHKSTHEWYYKYFAQRTLIGCLTVCGAINV